MCFGKVIGGGLPVGAFAARNEIMNYLAPVGPVYQAGTLSGNPLAGEDRSEWTDSGETGNRRGRGGVHNE